MGFVLLSTRTFSFWLYLSLKTSVTRPVASTPRWMPAAKSNPAGPAAGFSVIEEFVFVVICYTFAPQGALLGYAIIDFEGYIVVG